MAVAGGRQDAPTSARTAGSTPLSAHTDAADTRRLLQGKCCSECSALPPDHCRSLLGVSGLQKAVRKESTFEQGVRFAFPIIHGHHYDLPQLNKITLNKQGSRARVECWH